MASLKVSVIFISKPAISVAEALPRFKPKPFTFTSFAALENGLLFPAKSTARTQKYFVSFVFPP